MNEQIIEQIIEQLADAEHASWARWMAYLLSKCSHGSQGALIPLGLVEHWQRKIDTPYADLSEREKEKDRNEIRHILPFIEAAVAAAQAKQVRACMVIMVPVLAGLEGYMTEDDREEQALSIREHLGLCNASGCENQRLADPDAGGFCAECLDIG
jgi:hypothetical protein